MKVRTSVILLCTFHHSCLTLCCGFPTDDMFNNKPEITNRTVDTYRSGSVFMNKTGATTTKKGCLSRGSKPHISHEERLACAWDCAWQKPWEAPRPLPDLHYFSATDLGVCTFAQRWIRGLLAKLVKPCYSKT